MTVELNFQTATRTLGEAIHIKRGISWDKSMERDGHYPGTYPVLRVANVQEELELDDLVFLAGLSPDEIAKFAASMGWTILVGSNGNPDRVGNPVFIDRDQGYLFASFLIGVRPKADSALLPKYLYYYLKTPEIQQTITDSVQGTTGLKNLSQSFLRSLRLPDYTIEQQQRIVDILDTTSASIQQTDAVIAKLKQVKAGLLHDLLTRGLDENGQLRDPQAHPEQFKETEIGRVPREWRIATLRSLGSWHGGSTPSKSNPANWADGNILWLTPKDMQQSQILDTEDKVTDKALLNGRLKLFPPGHIAVVFRSGILRHTLPIAIGRVPFTVNQDMKVLSPDGAVDPEFAFWLLSGLSYDIRNSTMKSGTTVQSIDTQAFMNYLVGLPDLDEQRRIAEVFQSQSSRIRTEEAYRDKLQQAKRGLMQDLLTGRVRV